MLAGPLGLLFGSFLNVVIYRLPRGENLAFPASRCPACGAPIRPYHNVPLSASCGSGAARSCCKAPSPRRYPLSSLLGGLWALAVIAPSCSTLPGDTPIGRAGLLFAVHLALGVLLRCAISSISSTCCCPTRSRWAGPLGW